MATKGNMGTLQQRASMAMGQNKTPEHDADLRHETNVLFIPLLAGLQHKGVVNQLLALLSLCYAAVALVLIVLLSYPDRACEGEYEGTKDCEATPRVVFHNIEFWATFVFSVTEVVAIRYSPRNTNQIYAYPRILKLMISLNVAGGLVAAVLVSINLEFFEYPSHQIEYAHSILAAGVDVILLMSLISGRGALTTSKDRLIARLGMTFSALCFIAAIVQIGLYNGMGMDEDNVPIGETPAHYVEFSFDFVSAMILYFFCMDNVFRCDQEQVRLLTNPKDQVQTIKIDLEPGHTRSPDPPAAGTTTPLDMEGLEEYTKRRDTVVGVEKSSVAHKSVVEQAIAEK